MIINKYIKLILITLLFSATIAIAEENPKDPYEGFNRGVYKFNDTIDGAILKPIAMGYNYVTPDVAKKGVNNFYNNITDFITAVNSFLQLNFEQGMTDAGRVIVNTTVGLLGFIDVSSTNVNNYKERNKEDFGTTLARYGWRDSAYLVLPLFGPSTFRDGTGLVVDGMFIDPIGYIDNVRLRNALYVGKIINTRAQLLDATNLMDDASIDPYAFQRDSWLQMREAQIAGKQEIDYDKYLDYLSDDDTFDYATDDAVDTSNNQNQIEDDSISLFEDFNSVEEKNKTSQRPLASHLISSL
ncbi:MAG: VacJ family lipoprotein [Nitrosomonadales bacterium]|jgi:phospholipid-binding lipoprotein MlaA|nr:VacJ family lipoprotein [Nitrosomonadales bacterium]MBT6356112.1 VacJ family lipoprotein [Nitrosomonadales bacterium]